MSNSDLAYHDDGTVTFSDDPNTIVATWESSKIGAYNVFAYPDGKNRGFVIHDSPRSLADDYVRLWVEMIHGSKENIQQAA
jgi:hypothetical protein